VIKGDQGFRLIVSERLYTGPSSTAPFCGGEADVMAAAQPTPSSMILADRLASCSFSYREAIPDQFPSEKWLPTWNKPDLPAAVKIEMTPLDSSPALLPVLNVTVLIHVTREAKSTYEDVKQ
jgi:hypothetical protein